MVANQSKHTMQFSDLAWAKEDLDFPRSWMVGRYLHRYLETYPGANIKLGHRVVKTNLEADGSWKVSVDTGEGETTGVFDHLLIATGYFGKPIVPEAVPIDPKVPVIHTSKYRDLKSLLGDGTSDGGKILVVGGQMSGVEIAGTIATHISAASHSPDSPMPNAEKYTVDHLVQTPSWVFPLLTSPEVRPPTRSPLPKFK
jgi:cation diffusion facilitator CzcD-associated flavoprotein CzcO